MYSNGNVSLIVSAHGPSNNRVPVKDGGGGPALSISGSTQITRDSL